MSIFIALSFVSGFLFHAPSPSAGRCAAGGEAGSAPVAYDADDEDGDGDAGTATAGSPPDTAQIGCDSTKPVTFAVTKKKFKVEVKLHFTDSCPGGESKAWVEPKGGGKRSQVCKVGDQASTECVFTLDDFDFVHFACGGDSRGDGCSVTTVSRKIKR